METDKFFILDFDRCIGDTNGIQAVLERVIQNETGISPETFHAARTQVESEGQTFATIRHVHKLLEDAGSSVTWEHIRDKLLEACRDEELLLPHARELLRILGERSLHHGIITYGVEETWQLTKLEITGLLDVPHLVTHIEHKGELLTGWKREDGKFDVPPALLTHDLGALVARHLVFLDDKAKSFWGIPEGVQGVHVIAPGGNTLPAQQGETPDSVTEVTGIDGAIELLFSEEYISVS
jgi:hypothetical protein